MIQIILWAEIIDSMLGIFRPPFSIGLINAVRFTLSFPFQTKEYSKVFIFLINSFLFEMRTTLYKIFGAAKDLITWIFPSVNLSNASSLTILSEISRLIQSLAYKTVSEMNSKDFYALTYFINT